MLEIVRGRNWAIAHTVLDSEDGPPTDLSQFTAITSQIREKTAVKNSKGFFFHKLVADVTIETVDNILWLKLTAAATEIIQTGDYIVDVKADDESLLDPEPVKVVNRPTLS